MNDGARVPDFCVKSGAVQCKDLFEGITCKVFHYGFERTLVEIFDCGSVIVNVFDWRDELPEPERDMLNYLTTSVFIFQEGQHTYAKGPYPEQ